MLWVTNLTGKYWVDKLGNFPLTTHFENEIHLKKTVVPALGWGLV